MKIIMHPGKACWQQGFDYGTCPVIFELAEVHIGQVFKKNGKIYLVCLMVKSLDLAGVREIKFLDEPEDQDFKLEITCPACGYEEGDSWEAAEYDDEHVCQHCGATFSYGRVVTVEYNSSLVKMPEIAEL